jgi:predicted PurR-regulated permease PerM
MKKILDYLYIFSKLSTSLILLFILLVFGYLFYISFKNQEISNNDQSELINKLNQNVENLSKLSKKIEITESSLNQLKNSIQNITNSDQSNEVVLLNKKIEELDLGLKNILVDLKEIKTLNISESKKDLSNNILIPAIDKNKKEIIKLINYKFDNNLDFSE